MLEEEKQEKDAGSKSRGLLKIAVLLGVIIVPLVAGMVTYKLVIAPRLAETSETAPKEEESDKIPPTATSVSFDQAFVNVVMPDPNTPASLLVYTVSLECANKHTAELVTAHKARFTDMLNKLHEGHRREELNDPLVKESIQKQALQKANDILKRLQEKEDPEVRVLEVFHTQFAVQD